MAALFGIALLPLLLLAGQEFFRTDVRRVALNVTVADGGRFVTDLHLGDFEVYEDDVRQEVRLLDVRRVPLDVILLIDSSASMRLRLPTVHRAARRFMQVLEPGDRGAVVTFDDRVRVLQGLTGDARAIGDAIDSIEARGATALNTALYVTLKQFGEATVGSGEVRRQAVVLLSDGADTSSLVAFDDVLAVARRVGVTVYPIGLFADDSSRVAVATASQYLQTIARQTGARAFFPKQAWQLGDVYAAIAEELRAQYLIAYTPLDTAADGRFRRVRVSLPAYPHFLLRTRVGYTMHPAQQAR